jgi:hypothetical protein
MSYVGIQSMNCRTHAARETQTQFVSLTHGGAREYLFIGEIKSLITLSKVSLINHNIYRVYSLRDIINH